MERDCWGAGMETCILGRRALRSSCSGTSIDGPVPPPGVELDVRCRLSFLQKPGTSVVSCVVEAAGRIRTLDGVPRAYLDTESARCNSIEGMGGGARRGAVRGLWTPWSTDLLCGFGAVIVADALGVGALVLRSLLVPSFAFLDEDE